MIGIPGILTNLSEAWNEIPQKGDALLKTPHFPFFLKMADNELPQPKGRLWNREAITILM